MNKKKWLLYVEDPGAVNFFAPLVQALRRQKIAHEICACGHAIKLLKNRGIAPRRYRSFCSHGLVKKSCLVVVGTSENVNTPAFEFIDLASRLGTPSAAIVDSAANADFRFRGRTQYALSHAPNHLLVPDNWTRREYQRIGYPRAQVSVVGRPLPESRQSRTQNSLLDKKIQTAKKKRRQVIVFVSEVSTGLNTVQYKKNKSYDLKGRGKSILRTEIVMEEFLDAIKKVCRKDASRPFLILRRHPKETSKELGKLKKEFDAISTTEDPIELVKQADLVVGMSSILLEHAYYAGCKVLCISPRPIEKTWLEITRKKMVFWTSRRESIVRYLKNTFRENCLKDNNSKQTRLKKQLNFTVPTIITILKKLAR